MRSRVFSQVITMANDSKKWWIVILVVSIIGIVGGILDIIYHASMGEIMDAIGTTPEETVLHGVPTVAIVVMFLVSLWKVIKK